MYTISRTIVLQKYAPRIEDFRNSLILNSVPQFYYKHTLIVQFT